jgi:hypothetical protein
MKIRFLNYAAIATCCLLSNVASAELIALKWANGQFAYKATLGPKKFIEICGPLKKYQAINWRFSASGVTDFNIHYHVEKLVVTPVDQKNVAAASGITSIDLDQEYCWMWSNKGERAVDLEVSLDQAS